MVIFGYELRTK